VPADHGLVSPPRPRANESARDAAAWSGLGVPGDALPSGLLGPGETPPQLGVGGVSSLASTDQTVTDQRPATCPRSGDRVVMELHSGQVFPDRCRSSRCDFCLPINARRRCLAITLATPVRMIRLSLVGDRDDERPCDTALIRIKRIRQALKRMGQNPGEWCYTIEKNPKETGFHAHCLQTGGYLPQDVLQAACERARAGIPYINAIKRHGVWTSRYGLKGFGADGYGLKTFRPNADTTEALRINNGRLEHHTRGFYNFDGEVLRVRDMERAAIATMNADKPVAFIGMHQSSVPNVLSNHRLRYRLISDLNRRSAAQLRALS
jgi:hypothetical protein